MQRLDALRGRMEVLFKKLVQNVHEMGSSLFGLTKETELTLFYHSCSPGQALNC
jgi:hypothetical protein